MTPEEKGAREILENIFQTYRPQHRYVEVSEKDFRHLDLGFYRKTAADLEKSGFRHVSDIEDVSIAGAASKMFTRIMLRSLVSGDGTIMAGLYHPKPRFWTGLLLRILRCVPGKTVDLESELSDSNFIVTSNAESAALISSPPLLHAEYLREDATLPTLLERHRQSLDAYLRNHPGVSVKKAFTHSEIIASQNRMNALKAAFRGELKGISQAELNRFKGPQKVKEAIFEEIQKIQAEKRDESPDRDARLPKLGKTATGKPEILIARDVSHAGFAKIASGFVRAVEAKVENKADTVMERVWTLTIGGRSYCLSWDDQVCLVTLFAWDDSDPGYLGEIFHRWNESG